jgi:hypothetical protein
MALNTELDLVLITLTIKLAKTGAKVIDTNGAGRAYVRVYNLDTKGLNIVKKAMSANGVRYISKSMGFYTGYDNFRGTACSTAESIANALNNLGINAYPEMVGD